jgi:hypothetical protein
MVATMKQERFPMPEKLSQEREMSRVDAVRVEMASAVRLLGGEAATTKEATWLASRKTGLPARLIERLRYRKITRIAADVADTIREAIAAQQAKQEALARHEIAVLSARLGALESRFETVDPDFYGGEALPALQSIRTNSLLVGPRPSTTTEGETR